jgi:Cysteine rich repeat
MKYLMVGIIAFLIPAAGMAEGPCVDDVQKFCPGLYDGGGALLDCLKQHEAELSEACKTKVEALSKK